MIAVEDCWVWVENGHTNQKWRRLADEWRPMTYEEVVSYCEHPMSSDPTPEEIDQAKWDIQAGWNPHTKFDRIKEATARLARLGRTLREVYRC